MAMPVVVEAGLDLEPLAGEAGIEGGGAGDADINEAVRQLPMAYRHRSNVLAQRFTAIVVRPVSNITKRQARRGRLTNTLRER